MKYYTYLVYSISDVADRHHETVSEDKRASFEASFKNSGYAAKLLWENA